MEHFFDLKFRVEHITYQAPDSDYAIVRARVLEISPEENYNSKVLVVKGNFDKVEYRDVFRCYATWVDDPKFGRQVDAKMITMTASSDLDGIRRYLTRFIPGVGPKIAKTVVDAYGVDTLAKIRETPENLSRLKGVSKKKAEQIHKTLVDNDKIEKLSVFLYKNGVTSFIDIVNIYEAMGGDAEAKVRANPYSICDYLGYSKFLLADSVAKSLGTPENGYMRISKVIQYYLFSHCYNTGDMFVTKDFMFSQIRNFTRRSRISFSVDDNLLNQYFSDMRNDGSIVTDVSCGDCAVYLKNLYVIESKTEGYVKKLISPRESFPSDYRKFSCEYEKQTGVCLDDIQLCAVKNAYENRLSILTGGPGTGKTLTINAVIKFLEAKESRIRIVLCAPTGRAAKRMSELSGRNAYTIHRFLGLTGEDAKTIDAEIEIDADYVICDESSMIDAPLFLQLVSAVARSGASLLLVGDANQLPPVGVGLPFKDLLNSEKVPATILTRLYRQASESQINTNAVKILSGVTFFGEPNGLMFDRTKQDFFLFDTPDVDMIKLLIGNAIEQLSDVGVAKKDIVVLSPTKKGELGVVELNYMIQERFNPHNPYKAEYKSGQYVFRVGDRVMQEMNNYDLGVFNGDVGSVVAIDPEEKEIIVSYDDFEVVNGRVVPTPREVVYSKASIHELSLAYATTVHKAQGSECPVVIMPLSQMFFNLTRNIIYTAITRAKSRFVFIGDSNALVRGIQKNDNAQRATMLAAKI